MAEHRRYTRRQKVVAITSALASNVTAAAEATGIPATTIDYWMDQPEFVELRNKTRDDMARGFAVLVHRAQGILMEKLPTLEPRDLILLLGVGTDKAQLLSGAATERHEHRELDAFDDHETQQLVEAARRHLAGDTGPQDTEVVEGAAVEGAGEG